MNRVLMLMTLAVTALADTSSVNLPPEDGCENAAPRAVLHERWTRMISEECVQHGHGLDNISPFQQIHQAMGLVGQRTVCQESACPPGDPDCEKSYCNSHSSVSCTPNPLASDLERRSLCPYAYQETRNCNRYPSTLLEAKCRCSQCKTASGAVLPNTSCKEIHYNIPVLKDTGRREADGTAVYEKGYHPLAVGCACTANPASSV